MKPIHRSIIKITLLIVFVVVQLFSCTAPDRKIITGNKNVVVKGNLSRIDSLTQLVLSYTDIISGDLTQHIAVPDEKGDFQFRFPKYNEQDAELRTGNIVVPLYIIPGNNIQVQINNSSPEESVRFIGTNSEYNTEFYRLKNSLTRFIHANDSADQILINKEPDRYKSYVLGFEKKLLNFFNEYARENSLNSEISKWFRIYIPYHTANRLIFPYNYQNEKWGVDKNYWDFFDNYPVSNPLALSCSDYYRYCIGYFMYLANIENKNKFSETTQYYGHDFGKFYTHRIEIIDKSIKGVGSDIIIAFNLIQFMYDDINSFDTSKDQLINLIDNTDLQDLVKEKYSRLKNSLNETGKNKNIQIFDYLKDTTSTDILSILRNRHRGKIIYLDNWATWCGNCIGEMPHSVNLQKEFSGRDIVFVSICDQDNYKNDRAISIISENKVTGEHYLMNFQQTFKFRNLYKIRGIPRYMILDKNGEVINNNAPRPGSKQIRVELNKLLN